MRPVLVEDITTERGDGVVSFTAPIHWDSGVREPVGIFFAIDENEAWRVSPNPDSFRIPAAVVARHHGERRLSGGGPICPVLHSGLSSSLEWLARWSGTDRPIPTIEAELGCVHPAPEGVGASAAFFSGGVDSTALILANHIAYPQDHPLRISLGIVVVGIQSTRWTSWTGLKDRLAAARDDLSWIVGGAGIQVVPVVTNVRDVNRGGTFWKYEFQGAALAGVGHMFAPTISNLNIASTWKIRNLDNWGSHPLLDTGYGSHTLRIWHELAAMGRLDKTRLIARHPLLFEGLNVCNKAEGGDRNCGRCEKCLRTMLAIETMGSLDRSPHFMQSQIDLRDLKQIRILDRGVEGDYMELVDPLERVGRQDLASVVRRKVRQGRLLRINALARVRAWGSRVLPRTTRERLFGVRKLPR